MATRRTPFAEMERMMDEMRRSMFGDRDWADAPDRRAGVGAHVGLETDEDGYVVLVDLPGFETEEIDLRFEDGVLTIDAAHEAEQSSEREGGYVADWHSRRVSEQVRVPGEVLEDEVTATYRNGVLEVHLPTPQDDEDDDGTVIDID